uniref:7TM GPCR serpentine receptor class x (Srx) domain-containing protein n=1 Tax=Acrobeloides nanus TaxID=290746 RepID=A0A914CDQ9_9BILA
MCIPGCYYKSDGSGTHSDYTCTNVYILFSFYLECILAAICFILDGLCVIKIMKRNQIGSSDVVENQQRKREKIMVYYNCLSMIAFLVALIPYLLYLLSKQNIYTTYGIILGVFVYDSSKRAIGQGLDQINTLIMQQRMSNSNKNRDINF